MNQVTKRRPDLIGNTYSAKDRQFARTLASCIREDDGQALYRAAKQLLRKAAAGNLAAISMLADRLDGRVMQMPDIQHDGQLVVSWVIGAQANAHVIDAEPMQPSALVSTNEPSMLRAEGQVAEAPLPARERGMGGGEA